MEDAISYLERQHTAPGRNKEEGMLQVGEQTMNEIGMALLSLLLDSIPQVNETYKT
jgi:hypothetical protein